MNEKSGQVTSGPDELNEEKKKMGEREKKALEIRPGKQRGLQSIKVCEPSY